MTISEFYTLFPTERHCVNSLKAMREDNGITCKKCGCMHHYWLKAKEQWQCRECEFRTTLRSGTLFESSKLKLRLWFEAMFLVCNSKKGLSACELQRQLGLKRYEPAWYMMQKIRKAMTRINERQQASGEMEIDDAFFVTFQDPKNPADHLIHEPADSANGSKATLQKTLITVESMDFRHKPVRPGRMRMFRTVAVGGQTIWQMADPRENLKNMKSGYRSKRILEAIEHDPYVADSNRSLSVSPWIRTAIGNSRRVIYGIYHHVSTKFSQLYLDEFSFKFNFRQHPMRWKLLLLEALSFHW